MKFTTHTDEQVEAMFEEIGHGIVIDNVISTADTLADFAASAGKDWSYARRNDGTLENGLTYVEYTKVQVKAGDVRRDLVIIDLGDTRAVIRA